jgi:hypothetical protein
MIEKVTKEWIDANVRTVKFFRDDTLTIAVVTLTNGFKVIGESACMNPADFDAELGMKLAVDRALTKVWALEGYHRMSNNT